jgi:hypothetical protein
MPDPTSPLQRLPWCLNILPLAEVPNHTEIGQLTSTNLPPFLPHAMIAQHQRTVRNDEDKIEIRQKGQRLLGIRDNVIILDLASSIRLSKSHVGKDKAFYRHNLAMSGKVAALHMVQIHAITSLQLAIILERSWLTVYLELASKSSGSSK